MDKRTLTALLLMLALWLAFDQFVWKPQRESARLNQQNELLQQEPALADTLEKDATEPQLAYSDSLVFIEGAETQELELENDYVKVVFSSKGAVVRSIKLKGYDYSEGVPVDLIPENEAILGTTISQGSTDIDLAKRNFAFSENPEGKSISFYLGEEAEPQVLREYNLDEKYGIGVITKVQNLGNVNGIRLDLSAGIADSEKNLKTKAQDYRFFLYADNELLKLTLGKMRKKPPSGNFGSYGFAAVRSKYFTLALMETEPQLSRGFSGEINPDTENPGFSVDSIQRTAKSNWEQNFVLFAGPADASMLKTYGPQMENIAERGYNWLRWLANAFAWFLSWLYGIVKNYGVVIVIFAFLIKIVLHPLTNKSMSASFKMQQIQPQLHALQAKYKNDPKTLQVEMSKLYKEAGASPMSGCLPLLLQMPIFFALYNVLRYSLDMRNAGFVFWLKDLSEPDPYMILPILMGVFMIIQSKMMQPKQANVDEMDEKQKAAQSTQKMMTWMMPIMMFFIFKGMPAGLVLYWTVFNIYSVIQQYYLLKKHRN
ncbi:MAG: membrane protein insertase YidC [Candidatus Cloacimonetes bacterium]|nr:membrane protein insertase YidC [Candidatus Cloacimonadota bacterium]MCB5287118.1 membrane protein insertase YidC [Candidatus Cloacimonadota bacterium]MCK9183939.1 membrane protein insertase YidC [Candidatus Cloacimonadota bacterium]MCK9584561.1 membrane protein insertase YidC [Candidatus Cloacimonadota bacterium]MDY0229439.1 membrane protein insertase YidC [Candidatus Cloacimonadaceae bacterium]